MAEERPASARQIFIEALNVKSDERDAFLERACGSEPALRDQVVSLLRALDRAGDFLNAAAEPERLVQMVKDASGHNALSERRDSSAPPNAADTAHQSPCMPPVILADSEPTKAPAPGDAERPGTHIGPYKLLQLIGEGGFGRVFMAEQEKPVTRRVALKVIKLGMDTRQVIARFEAERQALALMDHPNIARVLDAGATDSGRPYFVMELVRGDPITNYCDNNHLTIPERLELFSQVCHAVQHAHQKGVIHRDIKPSNVIVSTQDGRPHAKVIDFGIAKATASRLTEKTLFTDHRALIGTPQYMSPEQAANSVDIDTRTDVYSLGVLLYELLTGVTPFDPRQLRSAAYGEMQRIIREVEPPKPSTRLSQTTDTLPTVAAMRRVEPRRLGVIIRGELDWIVMKALEKDRARRYDTANALAADVQRHLTGESVMAAPPGAGYRVRKFVRRHRGPVIAGGLIAAAVVAGILGTSMALVWANDARRIALEQRQAAVQAKENERREKESAIAARNEADSARREADRRREEVARRAYAANIAAAQTALDRGKVESARLRLKDCPEKLRGWEWDFLSSQLDTSAAKAVFPPAQELSVTVMPDQQSVLVATAGGELVRLRTRDWTEITRTHIPHKWLVEDGNPPRVVISPDGTRVLVGMNGWADEWQGQGPWLLLDAHTFQTLQAFGAETGLRARCSFSPDSTLIAIYDIEKRALNVYTREGVGVGRVTLPGGAVRNAFFDADSSVLVIGMEGGALLKWRRRDGQVEALPPRLENQVLAMHRAPDGNRMAVVYECGAVQLWSLAPVKFVADIPITDPKTDHLNHPGIVAWSPDSHQFAISGRHSVAIFHAASGASAVQCRMPLDTGRHYLSFSPDGQWLLLRKDADESLIPTVVLWEVATGALVAQLKAQDQEGFSDAVFNPDSSMLFTGTITGQIQRWTRTGRGWDPSFDALNGHHRRVNQLCFVNGSMALVSAATDGFVRAWDPAAPPVPIHALAALSTDAQFSADSQAILTIERAGGLLSVYSARSGAKLRDWGMLPGPREDDGYRGKYAEISAQRDLLAIDAGPHGIVCDTLTGSIVRRLDYGGHEPRRIALDGTFTAAAINTFDGQSEASVRLIDTASGKERWRKPVARERRVEDARGLALSQDSKVVAAPLDQRQVVIWDADTGTEVARCTAEPPASTMSFSPDGLVLAVGYRDGTARIWSASDGRQLSVLRNHTRPVITVEFSPDATRVATLADEESVVRLWEPRSGIELLNLPCYRPSRVHFSPDQRRILVLSGGLWLQVFDSQPCLQHPDQPRNAPDAVTESAALAALRASDDSISAAADILRQNPAALDVLARIQAERRRAFESLRNELWFRTDIVEALIAERGLSPGARREMIRMADMLGEPSAQQLNSRAWGVVREPGEKAQSYACALRAAKAAVAQKPDDGYFANTLGVAQYRCGLFADAKSTLIRSLEMNVKQKGREHVEDLAFLAMACFKLGDHAEARKRLDRCVEIEREGSLPDETAAFVAEAKILIASGQR